MHTLICRFLQPNDNSMSKSEFLGFALSYIINLLYGLFIKVCPVWVKSWFHWCPTSSQSLELEEREILTCK